MRKTRAYPIDLPGLAGPATPPITGRPKGAGAKPDCQRCGSRPAAVEVALVDFSGRRIPGASRLCAPCANRLRNQGAIAKEVEMKWL